MTDAEFARTFNTGLGMVMVVEESKLDQTLQVLRSAGETVWEVGRLIERKDEGCVVDNMKAWT